MGRPFGVGPTPMTYTIDIPDLGTVISLLMDWKVLAAEIKRRVDDLPRDLKFEMEELNRLTDEITKGVLNNASAKSRPYTQ
jgi:hypothetical protein